MSVHEGFGGTIVNNRILFPEEKPLTDFLDVKTYDSDWVTLVEGGEVTEANGTNRASLSRFARRGRGLRGG
jgi:hypothetical protein